MTSRRSRPTTVRGGRRGPGGDGWALGGGRAHLAHPLWRMCGPRPLALAGAVTCMIAAADGTLVVTGGEDAAVSVWRIA